MHPHQQTTLSNFKYPFPSPTFRIQHQDEIFIKKVRFSLNIWWMFGIIQIAIEMAD